MSLLQQEVMEKITELSDDNLEFILDIINRYMLPDNVPKKHEVSKRIGIAKGKDLYDDDYDFDEMNDEIAEMFGEM